MSTPTNPSEEEQTGASLTPLLQAEPKNSNPFDDDDNADANHHPTFIPNDTEAAFISAVTAQRMPEDRHSDASPPMLVPQYDPLAADDAAEPFEGVWKDSTCDWCVLVCVTMWCPIVALGQVMTRLRLDWLARPLPAVSGRFSTCFIVTAIVALPWMLHLISFAVTMGEQVEHDMEHHSDSHHDDSDNNNSNNNSQDDAIHDNNEYNHHKDPFFWFGEYDISPMANTWHSPIISLFMMLIALWRIYILCKTRQEIRRRHNIRQECCNACNCCCCADGGAEDLCCACCCPHLAIYQISRHTGDFRHQRAVCCNATGLGNRPTRQVPPVLV